MKKLLLAFLLSLSLTVQADMVLREDTNSQTRQIGPFVDSAGAILTGLTISNTDVMLSKDGAAAVAKNSGGCSHDVNGLYLCTFDSVDSSTAGSLQISVVETGALPVYHEFQNVTQSVYDACCASSSAAQPYPLNFANLAITGGGAITAGTVSDKSGYFLNGTQAFNNTGTWTGSLTGSVGSATSVTNPVTVGTNNDKTGYALSTAGNEAVLNVVVEDMGNISARCMLAVNGAILSGDYTTVGNTTTFRDSTGAEIRMTSTQTTTARTVTITCPTY